MLSSSNGLYIPTYFARQPVFTLDSKIWGYELLYRHGPQAEAALFEDKDAATLNVLANAITSPCADALRDHKVMINFPPRCIVQRAPYALPAPGAVLQISESAPATPQLIDALQRLKEDGYAIALDDFEYRPGAKELLELADCVVIDVLGPAPNAVRAVLQRLDAFPGQRIAKRVESRDSLRHAHELGFTLFQGFFFQKPELVAGRTLSASEIAKLNLIKAIEAPEPDFEAVGEEIARDLSLSYRLLRLINSPAFGLAKKIDAIKQALLILGQKQLKQWLRLILLTDLAPGDKSSELPYLSVLRARFLQELAPNAPNAPHPDSLYLLGLFSLLDAILDLPPAQVLPSLPLNPDIVAALCKETNAFSAWLGLAVCFESGNFNKLEQLCAQLHIDPIVASQTYFNAARWTKAFFEIAGNARPTR